MKFSCHVDINQSIHRVVPLFINPDNLKYWQDGFVSKEPISGDPGKPGSRSKFVYQIGKRKIELIETIRVNNLPEEFTALYEAKEMVNLMTNKFREVQEGQTRYTAHVEYTRFKGLIVKLMTWLMPGMFIKQVQKWMDQFKEFVENEARGTRRE